MYKSSWVFLSPSCHEAFGYAAVEATYCGTQVIASDVPGQSDLEDIPHISWINPDSIEKLQLSLIEAYNGSGSEIRKIV